YLLQKVRYILRRVDRQFIGIIDMPRTEPSDIQYFTLNIKLLSDSFYCPFCIYQRHEIYVIQKKCKNLKQYLQKSIQIKTIIDNNRLRFLAFMTFIIILYYIL